MLNGPSSAGKTTLATALQRRFAADGECWFIYAMDDYFAKVPFDWVTAGAHVGARAEEGVVLEIVDGSFRMRLGPIGRQVLVAWRGAVASAVRAGLNVIADDVVLTDDDWRGWQIELAGLDAHWVRVQIDLDLLEAREQARPDRMPGQARSQYHDGLPTSQLRRGGRHRGPRSRRRGRGRPGGMALARAEARGLSAAWVGRAPPTQPAPGGCHERTRPADR